MTVKEETPFSFCKAIYIFSLDGCLTNGWQWYATKYIYTSSLSAYTILSQNCSPCKCSKDVNCREFEILEM
jgi:hypothetical protein